MRITVLLGGTSSERNVSLASGLRVCAALRERGHRVTPLDPAKGVLDAAAESRLAASGVGTIPPTPDELRALERDALTPVLGTLPEVRDADVVFLALHGGQGEDGTIQAVLDLAGVPYTGSGRLASALAMDKDLSKTLFRAAGVNTADWVMTTAEREGKLPCTLPFPLPVVVKPSKQGSTVGLTVVKRPEQLEPAIAEALRHDDEVMIERFVPEDPHGEFSSGDELLEDHGVVVAFRLLHRVGQLLHIMGQGQPQRRTPARGLHDHRKTQAGRGFFGSGQGFSRLHRDPVGRRDAAVAQQTFGEILVHRERAARRVAARVGQARDLEQRL